MDVAMSPAPIDNSSAPTMRRLEQYEVRVHTRSSEEELMDGDGDVGVTSSPFVSLVKDDQGDRVQEQDQEKAREMTEKDTDAKENKAPSPLKARHTSRFISGTGLSPLKILQERQENHETANNMASQPSSTSTPDLASAAEQSPLASPRKLSWTNKPPIKRFPVKPSVSHPEPLLLAPEEASHPDAAKQHNCGREGVPMSLEGALRDNEGLKKAIEIFEDEVSELDHEEVDSTFVTAPSASQASHDRHHLDVGGQEDATCPDDTMTSTFSTFSAVPNLTMLEQIRSNSPTKVSMMGVDEVVATPRPSRAGRDRDSGTTTNLLEFTEQLRFGSYATPSRRRSPNRQAPPTAKPHNKAGINPLSSLLDFDIPPLPTPRSIPTITPRELESLKSSFLSEISSLKASLSGKEAEAASLKTAVGNAETRVGEAMEQLRDTQAVLEMAKQEKDEWQRRSREIETVLRQVREDIARGQRDRDDLEAKIEESEKRREAAEMMAQEAESKMAGMRAAGRGVATSSSPSTTPAKNSSCEATNKEVEMVARELHALYKSKHETKVAALKKSYEHRWEKRVAVLQKQVDDLQRENEELRVGRDATMVRVDPARLSELEAERKAERSKDAARIQELVGETKRLGAEMRSVRTDNEELRSLLERERVEKGELVMLAEEMMSMQQSFVGGARPRQQEGSCDGQQEEQSRTRKPPSAPATGGAITTPSKTSRHSIAVTPGTSMRIHQSRPLSQDGAHMMFHAATKATGMAMPRASGLRAPVSSGLRSSATESRIGRSVVPGLPRPGSGLKVRSVGGIMSSIEKMGSYNRRGE